MIDSHEQSTEVAMSFVGTLLVYGLQMERSFCKEIISEEK